MSVYSIKKLVGPAIILISIALMHLMDYFTPDVFFRPLPGLLVVFMLTPLVLGEAPDSLLQIVEATAISMSAWLSRTPVDALQVTLMALSVAAASGWIYNRAQHLLKLEIQKTMVQSNRADINQGAADTMETLNGNIEKVKESRERLYTVLKTRAIDPETADELRAILHLLNNLELATAGWLALKKFIATMRRELPDHKEGRPDGSPVSSLSGPTSQ